MTVPKTGANSPPYQVTHTIHQAGKLFTGSKHRVNFSFGFANPDALRQGLQGPDARGEEHEIKLVWSHTSGKRQVVADGQEVHFSVGKKLEARFESSWTMEGGHTVKLVAHATKGLSSHHQFDLFLDGMSYFSMPKIYELGQSSAFKGRQGQTVVSNYQSSVPEGRDFAQAPTRALDSSRRATDDASGPGKRAYLVESPAGVADMSSAQARDFLFSQEDDLLRSVKPPELHSCTDEFSPVEATGATPSFALATNQIMSAYNPIGANQFNDAVVPYQYGAILPALPHTPPSNAQNGYSEFSKDMTPSSYYDASASFATPPSAHQPYYPAEQQYQSPASQGVSETPSPTVTLTMAPLTVEDLDEQSAAQLTGVSKAVHSLVNLDDINEQNSSPEDRKFQQKKAQANRQFKSKPLPPKQADWSLGLQPNLQAMKERSPQKTAPTKEIMRTHAFDPNAAQAGMMVAYGTQFQPQPLMHHCMSHYS